MEHGTGARATALNRYEPQRGGSYWLVVATDGPRRAMARVGASSAD